MKGRTPIQQEARRWLFGEKLNSLTFRHMDEIFDTVSAANGAKVWKLPEEAPGAGHDL